MARYKRGAKGRFAGSYGGGGSSGRGSSKSKGGGRRMSSAGSKAKGGGGSRPKTVFHPLGKANRGATRPRGPGEPQTRVRYERSSIPAIRHRPPRLLGQVGPAYHGAKVEIRGFQNGYTTRTTNMDFRKIRVPKASAPGYTRRARTVIIASPSQ